MNSRKFAVISNAAIQKQNNYAKISKPRCFSQPS